MSLLESLKDWLVRMDYAWKNASLWLLRRLLFKPIGDPAQVRKLLVFRTGSMGDNLCAFPALDALRKHFAQAELHLLTRTGGQGRVGTLDLLRPGILAGLVDYEGMSFRALGRRLKAEGFDLFVQLPQVDAPWWRQARDLLAARLWGIPSAFGWRVSTTYFLPRHQERHRRFPNETDRLLGILAREGVPIPPERDYLLGVFDPGMQHVQRLADSLRPKGEPMLALAIGSKIQRNKWPLKYFQKVAAHFIERGFVVLVVGGPEDEAEAARLAQLSPVVSFCGRLKPLESALLMHLCDLVISNDTGPMHLAYAVGTPVLGIFSSREYPGKWFPPKSRFNRALRSEGIPCAMCAFRDCPDQNNFCMKRIYPARVIAEAEQILREGRP